MGGGGEETEGFNRMFLQQRPSFGLASSPRRNNLPDRSCSIFGIEQCFTISLSLNIILPFQPHRGDGQCLIHSSVQRWKETGHVLSLLSHVDTPRTVRLWTGPHRGQSSLPVVLCSEGGLIPAARNPHICIRVFFTPVITVVPDRLFRSRLKSANMSHSQTYRRLENFYFTD